MAILSFTFVIFIRLLLFFLWQSFEHPCDTQLPGMKLGWDRKTGLNRQITAWKSWDDPSSGNFTFGILRGSNIDIDPEIVMWNGSVKFWSTGPWSSFQFNKGSIYTYKIINNKDEVFYSYGLKRTSMIARVVMNQTTYSRKRFVWNPETGAWNNDGAAPTDKCDVYNACGPNANCFVGQSPICQCLEGFKPKSLASWTAKNWTQGCVPSEPWSCEVKDKNGFVIFAGVKMLDTTNAWVDKNMTLADCKAKCLENCSCTAYSNNLRSVANGNGCSIWFGDLINLKAASENGQSLYVY